eukprot:gene5790-60716_t
MRVVVLAAGAAALPAAPPKPHIFVAITPDPAVTCPNSDALMKKGLNLTRHYTYNYCSPSRSSFQG